MFDTDTDQVLSRIATANRTCAIWIGLGDAHGNGGGEQTGDMHIAVYDFGVDLMFVANASPDGEQLAYDSTFVQFTMSKLWQTLPTWLSTEL